MGELGRAWVIKGPAWGPWNSDLVVSATENYEKILKEKGNCGFICTIKKIPLAVDRRQICVSRD